LLFKFYLLINQINIIFKAKLRSLYHIYLCFLSFFNSNHPLHTWRYNSLYFNWIFPHFTTINFSHKT